MERKTVHALLLSLAVVAGGVMMTTDAHAQTNTERLMTTVDNTNTIIAALEALADAVADGFAAVLAAIGAVQTGVDGMSGHLEHLESDVAGISSDVASVDSSVAAVSSDVASIASDVDDISSSLQDVQSDVAGLSAGIGGSAAALTSVTDAIQRNANAINSLNEKLDMISEAVGAVQTTVETQEDVDPAVKNMLHTAETEQAVAVADFAGTVTKAPTNGVYKASNIFSCTGDVFVDDLSVTRGTDNDDDGILNSVSDLTDDTTDNPTVPKSTITVEGFPLFELIDTSDADTNPTDVTTIEVDKVRNFDNRFLRAGDGIMVNGQTDQSDHVVALLADASNALATNHLTYEIPNREGRSDPATDRTVYFTLDDYVGLKNNKALLNATTDRASSGANAYNATKATLGAVEIYTITVNWFAASSDTTCSISSAVETTSGLPNDDNTVLVALNIDETSTEGPPTPFTTATLDCNGEDTEITNISIQAGALRNLNQFIEVTLTAGGEPSTVSFDTDNTADTDGSDLPFRFSGSDLTVGGEGIGTLLLQITYDTTQGNTCKAS